MTEAEYDKKADELLKRVAPEVRDAFKHLGYAERHSYGWDDVWDFLSDLVYYLEDPLAKLEWRIVKETLDDVRTR